MRCFPIGISSIVKAGKIETFKLFPADIGKPLTLDRVLIVTTHVEEDLLVLDVSFGTRQAEQGEDVLFHPECFKEADVRVSWVMGANPKTRGCWTDHPNRQL